MKKVILFHSVVLSILCLTHADETDINKDFESLLNNVSELATKKSLNVDYLPSVVSIIDAQTYRDAGIQTIAEALDMLPGIQMQLSPMGYTTTTVRGLKMPNAYLSDKIKILIDGVAINAEVTGSSSFYMDFPMQLVEKIEVLRGPNSTLYGAGAFYGTVNVITKLGSDKKENQLFAGVGSYQYRTAGANINMSSDDWKLFADGYYKSNNKALNVKNNDQDTEEDMQDFSVGFKAVNGGFEFLTRLKQSTYGNFYSFEGDRDPIPERDQGHTSKYFFSQFSYKTDLNEYKLETKANFSQNELDIKANLYSVADVEDKLAPVITDMHDGFYYHENTKEQNFEAEAILTFPVFYSNDILVGIGAREARMTNDDFFSSVENTIISHNIAPNASFDYNIDNELAFWTNPTTKLLKDNLHRTITYAYIQDLISVNKDVDIILGLRTDDYSDYGAQLSKRAALVYRYSDHLILKLLYGSAFRVPTFTEAYANGHINFRAGDSNIVPEETDTYETDIIYTPNTNHKFSLNLFYSYLKNVIDLEETGNIPGYQNFKPRYSKGIEFEYFYRLAQEHNLYFNGTYIYSEYTIPSEGSPDLINQSMPDISKVMFKAMYVYRPTEKLSLGTTWRYFSETTPTKLDWAQRWDNTVDAVHIFDETATYRFSSNSEMRLTVKNMFNREIRQPTYYYRTPGGIEREGRNYFLSYIYNF